MLVPIGASIMTWSFDERTLLVVVLALVGSLVLLMTALRGQAARGTSHPAPKPVATCPGDQWCPGPTWHILFSTGLPSAQLASFSMGAGGSGGAGRPMTP